MADTITDNRTAVDNADSATPGQITGTSACSVLTEQMVTDFTAFVFHAFSQLRC